MRDASEPDRSASGGKTSGRGGGLLRTGAGGEGGKAKVGVSTNASLSPASAGERAARSGVRRRMTESSMSCPSCSILKIFGEDLDILRTCKIFGSDDGDGPVRAFKQVGKRKEGKSKKDERVRSKR